MLGKVLRAALLALSLIGSGAASAVEWELTRLDGKTGNLKDYEGQWIVVNFWATWCPPCREEIPELIQFHGNHKGKAVVLGVNFEELGLASLKEFTDENMMDYPIFQIAPANETPVGPVPGLPTTYMISPQGEVVARQVGMVDEAMLSNFIKEWEANHLVDSRAALESSTATTTHY